MAGSLYQAFQEALTEGEGIDLDPFKDRAFWEELGDGERLKLALLFLQKGEQLVMDLGRLDLDEIEDLVIESFLYAEQLAPEHMELLCREALASYRLGVMAQKGRYFIFALEKLTQAQVVDPAAFSATHQWWHLWGQVLSALSQYTQNETFLIQAIEKLEQAAAIELNEEILWDSARVWSKLSQCSSELSDAHKALSYFRQAQQAGERGGPFLCDFAETLIWVAHLTGRIDPLDEAGSLSREVIAGAEMQEQKTLLTRGWTLRAIIAKKRVELTGAASDFEAADQLLHEAILAVPHHAPLWLAWGELFLRWGWIRRELPLVETALEKLTSLKIGECDPMDVSGLLGCSIVLLGLLADDLKLIQEGASRIEAALDIDSEHRDVRFAHAFSLYARGAYFHDEEFFERGRDLLRSLLEEDSAQVFVLYMLFRCQLGLARIQEDREGICAALGMIARVCEMRPLSAPMFGEWGQALICLYELDEGGEATLEEAVSRFAKAMDLDDDPIWQFNHGCALDTLGNLTGDEETFERAVEELADVYQKRPDVLDVGYHLARSLLHFGELTSGVESLYQAVDLYKQVVEHDPEDDTAWCEFGYALLNLSELVDEPVQPDKGRQLREKAEGSLLRAAELGNGPANYHLACLYALSEMKGAAMDYLKRAQAARALPQADDLAADDWLDNLHDLPEFRQLLTDDQESS